MRSIEDEWKLDESIIYLNHAAVAPWPARSVKAVNEFSRQNLTLGSKHYPEWLKTEHRLKQHLRLLINAPSENDIALVKNTSEGLSLVAYGLEWNSGDNIVSSNQEFPSNRIVWESLATEGVTFRAVDLNSADSPEQSLINACDNNTRLLSISSVQYASGLKMDLTVLGRFCRENNILFCVDAIQSAGAMQLDVVRDYVDFMAADSHKWMLGPEGIGFFYCSSSIRDRLKLNQYGWHMVEHMGDYERLDWQIAQSSRRFECGSPNMLGTHAFEASLSLLHEVGMTNVEARVLDNCRLIIEFVEQNARLELLSSRQPGKYAGICTFRHKSRSNNELFTFLNENGVMCAMRGGGIRFSPHYYTEPGKIVMALEMAARK